VAQFGGVPGVALAGGGRDVHDRAPVRVTAHGLGGRLAAGFEGQVKVKTMVKSRRLRRASATGVGRGCVVGRRSLLVVASVPDPPSLSSP